MSDEIEDDFSVEEPQGGGGKRTALIAAGVGGVALLGFGAYWLASGGLSGAGQADANGDGFISIAEFREEMLDLEELQTPLPGRWKVVMESKFPEGGDDNFAKADFEFDMCGERDQSDFDKFFDELRGPDALEQMERAYEQFQDEANGEIMISRFTIDGDEIDFAVEVKGSGSQGPGSVSGNGKFELTGTISGERIQLSGPVQYAMDVSSSEGEVEGSFEFAMNGEYDILMERQSPCF